MGEIDVPELVNPVVRRISGGLAGVVDIGGIGIFPDLEQIVLLENLNDLLGKIAVRRALDADRVVAGNRRRVRQEHEGRIGDVDIVVDDRCAHIHDVLHRPVMNKGLVHPLHPLEHGEEAVLDEAEQFYRRDILVNNDEPGESLFCLNLVADPVPCADAAEIGAARADGERPGQPADIKTVRLHDAGIVRQGHADGKGAAAVRRKMHLEMV